MCILIRIRMTKHGRATVVYLPTPRMLRRTATPSPITQLRIRQSVRAPAAMRCRFGPCRVTIVRACPLATNTATSNMLCNSQSPQMRAERIELNPRWFVWFELPPSDGGPLPLPAPRPPVRVAAHLLRSVHDEPDLPDPAPSWWPDGVRDGLRCRRRRRLLPLLECWRCSLCSGRRLHGAFRRAFSSLARLLGRLLLVLAAHAANAALVARHEGTPAADVQHEGQPQPGQKQPHWSGG